MIPKHFAHPFRKSMITICLIATVISGCTFNILGGNPPTPTSSFPLPPTPQPLPKAEIFFAVTLPTPIQEGESIYLSIIDDVTGLAINPVNYTMQAGDDLHYYIALPFALNSVVKYRYIRQSTSQIIESNFMKSTVRFRLYYVGGPGEVMDSIYGWSDNSLSIETGRITGTVISNEDGNGVADILISAGGLQTMTDSNGNFTLEGLVAGTHNLVAYSVEGHFQTFQQGARILAGKRTPVKISLASAEMVNVLFTVIVPWNTVPATPIRLAGNLYQLGNSFGDLQGGINGVSSRMPILTPMVDGRYTLSLMLPVGADIRYKYTLGDGFWNAEHQTDGNFILRQLIVPPSGGPVQDVVDTWQAGKSAPILFDVTVPENTSETDIVSIQFNPYGWTEPIQMWPLGNKHWVYQLFSPLNLLNTFEYRYCRNDLCGTSDESNAIAPEKVQSVKTSLEPKTLSDVIDSWNWFSNVGSSNPGDFNVNARQGNFIAGVELQTRINPSWQPWMDLAAKDIQSMGANLVVVTPTWTFQNLSPLVFNVVPGKDPLGSDVTETIHRMQSLNLNVAVFPNVHLPTSVDEWWTNAPRDAVWWDNWFKNYRSFALYYADLAASNNTQSLILGGDWLLPAYPGGTLADGSSSNPPADAETRWSSLIAEIRQRFNGQLYWAIPYPGGIENAPGLIFEVDGIYLLWHASLAASETTDQAEIQTTAESILDHEIWSFHSAFQKPIILSFAYPSIRGTAMACVSDGNGNCLDWTTLDQPNVNSGLQVLDLKAQEDVYLVLLKAVNDRAWINGFISRGYYPPAALQDLSASIHGKPSEAVLRYWFPRWLGLIE